VDNIIVGLMTSQAALNNNAGQDAYGWGYYSASGNKKTNGTLSAYGASYTNNDIIGIAFDADAGTLTFYKNNTSQGTAFTGLTSGPYMFAVSLYGTCATSTNFGQRPFAYTAPSGFKALCTQNLPTPTIGATSATQAGKFFNPVLYTGTGSSNSVTGVGFQPDWTWIKSRSNGAYHHRLTDVVRGVTKEIYSNLTNAEGTDSNGLTAFVSDGFTVGSSNEYNASATTFVAWNWKANGSGSSNTSGSITSTVSANTTSGFSVVTYTGTGSAATVGHGLGATPKMIIGRSRTNSGFNWGVWHTSLQSLYGNNAWIRLNTTDAYTTTFDVFDPQNNTSSVFGIGTEATMNANASNYVAYCFAEVAGYSAFGSYTGNSSTDGTFVYLGFRPAYMMIKASNAIEDWVIMDVARSPYNGVNLWLNAEDSSADATLTPPQFDFNSNGMKLRGTSSTVNATGTTYIYMAFASNPFKTSLAR
jgi:hypothetical protein